MLLRVLLLLLVVTSSRAVRISNSSAEDYDENDYKLVWPILGLLAS
jgi:hypothetical protein